jgi:hypothetical protein
MTREEHLEFCKKCLNRKFDFNQGIICGLNGKIAAFKNECKDFEQDSSVNIIVDNEEVLSQNEIKEKLPSDIYERLRFEQNLFGAIIAGFTAAILAAILWAIFTVTFMVQFRVMAILVGLFVGFAMRRIGKGIDLIFGISGAALSLFGCLLGNFFSIMVFASSYHKLGFFETMVLFNYDKLIDAMIQTFDFRQIIAYLIATVVGFGLAKRFITAKDIIELKKSAT